MVMYVMIPIDRWMSSQMNYPDRLGRLGYLVRWGGSAPQDTVRRDEGRPSLLRWEWRPYPSLYRSRCERMCANPGYHQMPGGSKCSHDDHDDCKTRRFHPCFRCPTSDCSQMTKRCSSRASENTMSVMMCAALMVLTRLLMMRLLAAINQ